MRFQILFSETFSCPIIIMFSVNIDFFFSEVKTFPFVCHEPKHQRGSITERHVPETLYYAQRLTAYVCRSSDILKGSDLQ